MTDPTGDQVDPFAPLPDPPGYNPTTQDIQGIFFAELASTPDKITYTMKVANLATVPQNGSWRIRWQAPDGNTYFVSMDTDQNSVPSYSYGTYTVTQGQGNYTSSGAADAGSFTADGYIHITNSNTKTGSPNIGQQLTSVFGETDLLIGSQQTGGLLATVDDTTNATPASASYTLVGNIFCGPPNTGGTRTPTYVHGGMTFSSNTPIKAPSAHQNGEPSSRVDAQGNFYIMPIRGVPGGVDLWYFDLRPSSSTFDPNMRVPVYRGQPDSPTSAAGQNQLQAGALGGGDIDVALGIGNYAGDVGIPLATPAPIPAVGPQPNPVLAYASLTAANVTVGRSLDRGQTFQFNGAGNVLAGIPVNDRQWMGFIGTNNVFLVYRNFAQGIAFVQQSTNGGLSYGPAFPAGGIAFPQTGALDVDQATGVVYVSSNDGHIAVGDPAANTINPTTPGTAPENYTVHAAVPAGVDSANIFFPIRVATVNHTVYGVYSDGHDIYLVSSADKGITWTAPARVNDPSDPLEKTNLMPWLAVGPGAGSVGVVWYGTDDAVNDNAANWRVFFAQTLNGDANNPQFRIVQASDHAIHTSNVSLKGLVLLGANPNRNLIDYFQVNFDPQGAAAIGWTDDHADFDGQGYVARQISGPSINGTGNLPAVQEGASLPSQPFVAPGTTGNPPPQPMQPGPNGEQVTDFAQDQDSGLLAVTPTNSPLDILTIKYVSQDSNQGFFITATMKLSDLTAVPVSTTWRMYFAANGLEVGDGTTATLSGGPGNYVSKGLPERGDYFYLDMKTDNQGNRTFNWGTTVRNTDGSTTDTQRGSATSGFVNQGNGTISVRMSVNTLNTYLDTVHSNDATKHIQFGSVLCGLRGRAQQTNAAGEDIVLEDFTRAGTEFKIGNPF